MPRRVVITGIGILSPVGLTRDSTWGGLLAGKSGIDRIGAFDPEGLETRIAGEVEDFDPTDYVGRKEARHMDRFAQLAVGAALEAVDHADLNINGTNAERVAVIISSGIGGLITLEEQIGVLSNRGARRVNPFLVPMMLPDMASGQVSMLLGAKGPNFATVSACSSSGDGIGLAFDLVRNRSADVVLAGGAEAAISPIGVAGFNACKALSKRNDEPQKASRPFDAGRDGFVLGEGAAVLVMESLETAEARGVEQPKEHYWDVFNHLIETTEWVQWLLQERYQDDGAVAKLGPSFPSEQEFFAQEATDGHTRMTLLKLAGLLHDIAKPATKSIESNGRMRFFGHSELGAEMAAGIMKRLRFSQRGVELVSKAVEQHLRPGQMAQKGEMPTARAVYRYYRDVGEAALDTIYLNLADYLAARGPMLGEEEWAEHCAVASHILQGSFTNGTAKDRPKLLDGHDVMKVLSMPPGPTVRHYLERVREAQASGEIESREEAIELVGNLSKDLSNDA